MLPLHITTDNHTAYDYGVFGHEISIHVRTYATVSTQKTSAQKLIQCKFKKCCTIACFVLLVSILIVAMYISNLLLNGLLFVHKLSNKHHKGTKQTLSNEI